MYKNKTSSPQEAESREQDLSQGTQLDCERSSSSSPAEEDHLHPSLTSHQQDGASPRASFSRRDPEMSEHDQDSAHSHEIRPVLSPPDSATLAPELPIPPPNYLHNSVGDLIGGMVAPQAHLLSREYGYGYRRVPSHQEMIPDPRSFALGQITAAARFKMAADSLEHTADSESRRRPRDEEEGAEQKKDGRKRKKHKTQGKQAERWDQMFERLVEFKKLHGHCLVPNRYANDPSLGAWVSTQRRHYKILTSGRTDLTTPMNAERASRLANLGFAWSTSDPRHVPWETRFQELLAYKEEHGMLLRMYV